MNTQSAEPKQVIYHGVEEVESNFPPLSPISQSLKCSSITLIILALFEFETPIDEPATLDFIRNKFLPMSPRFSSIIETEKNGVQRWKKVDIRVEDHLIVPTFPDLGVQKSREEYDVQLREYMSKIGCENFPENKPLWEIHLIKYPSLNGVRSLVFKLSHAIGDGYSYAKLLFFAFNKAGNPSLPLTLPQLPLRQQNGKADTTAVGKLKRIRKSLGFISEYVFSVPEIVWSLLKAANKKDHPTPIRSETPNMELLRPVNISTMSFSLERIKQVKSMLGATVNDVIMGMIAYIIHLYMVKMGHISSSSVDMNILVMVNMRVLKGYKNMEEMIKAPDSWGNHSRFMSVPIPSFSSTDLVKVNPLDFIIKAKEIMSKKKSSLLIYMTEGALKLWTNIRGQEGLEEVVYNSFSNSSTMISSLIGPKEQMAIKEHPINSFYYLVAGIPQSLAFTSVSCMGELKLVASMEKGFIDSKIFTGCMNQAFEDIFEAAFGNKCHTEKCN